MHHTLFLRNQTKSAHSALITVHFRSSNELRNSSSNWIVKKKMLLMRTHETWANPFPKNQIGNQINDTLHAKKKGNSNQPGWAMRYQDQTQPVVPGPRNKKANFTNSLLLFQSCTWPASYHPSKPTLKTLPQSRATSSPMLHHYSVPFANFRRLSAKLFCPSSVGFLRISILLVLLPPDQNGVVTLFLCSSSGIHCFPMVFLSLNFTVSLIHSRRVTKNCHSLESGFDSVYCFFI